MKNPVFRRRVFHASVLYVNIVRSAMCMITTVLCCAPDQPDGLMRAVLITGRVGWLFFFAVGHLLQEALDRLPVERDKRVGIFLVELVG